MFIKMLFLSPTFKSRYRYNIIDTFLYSNDITYLIKAYELCSYF